jgi:D-beta-D-heptose 7-phosphate kinase/D-beta-D-heptose 1-phosphate adenosyltransferase
MILVVGDSILDVYIEGTSTRLCPEAPAPVILNPTTTQKLGGAINVFSNLLAFQPTVELLTDKENISKKTRIVCNGVIELRIDEEQRRIPPKGLNYDVREYSLLVLSDYNKGCLAFAPYMIADAITHGVPVFVDPKREFEFYRGATLIKANKAEVEFELQKTWTNSVADAHDLCQKFGFQYLVVTLGENGIFFYDDLVGASLYAAGWAQNVVDVTGAGDVVLATLAHYFDKGVDMVEAATRANIFASKSTTVLGNYVLTKEDIESVEDGVYQRGLRPFTRRPFALTT